MTPLTPPSAAPPADLLAVAQSKAVPPASGVSGFDVGLSPPTPLKRLSMSSPAMPAPVTPEGVFGPMPVGGAMIGGDAAQTPPSFPILATPIAAMTPAPMTPHIPHVAMTLAPMTPDIPHATMTPAPTTPDIHHATMTSAPTTPVSYPFQMEESRPPHQWNYPIYEGKGEDMRLGVSKGKGRLPAYEREYPLPKPPSVPPLPQLGVNLPMPPPPPQEYAAAPTTPPTPRPTGVESPPPPPSPDAMSEASDSAVLERGLRAEGCACEATPLSGLLGLSALDELCMENARQLATLAVVAVWKVPLGTEQCVAPRMPGTWCSGSLKADFLSQGA